MIKSTTLFLLTLTTSFLLSIPAYAQTKNIIVMIADGWGENAILATEYWRGDQAVYQNNDWNKRFMSTFMFHEGNESPPNGDGSLTGIHGYDSDEMWQDFAYHLNYATDSGAASTAMSTGVKTSIGSIGIGPEIDGNTEVLYHISERCEALGFATGVVTSVMMTHATPAGFVAHNSSRGNYAEIGAEMIHDSGLEVLVGCGNPYYSSRGAYRTPDPNDEEDWKYVGGKLNWESLSNGTAGGTHPWTLVEDKADFEAISTGTMLPPNRLFGAPKIRNTLQLTRSSYPEDRATEIPFTTPLNQNIPSLATLTSSALKVLEQNEMGFFLMVEGGAIDWAAHSRSLARTIEEMVDFNSAVNTVIDWVEDNDPNWEETLVIITGDHETGALWGPEANTEEHSFQMVQDQGAGVLPLFHYFSEPRGPDNTAGHTNQLIPIFFKGIGSEILSTRADQVDSYRGEYLDNTDIALTIFELLHQVSIEDDYGMAFPTTFSITNAYPNPFNPSCSVDISIPQPGEITYAIYNIHGQHVYSESINSSSSLFSLNIHADKHNINSSGTYLLNVSYHGTSRSQKIVLIK